ncbi:hypothetical protein GCM10027176_23980 [Actinoallomurus bryophytorum]|uniref:LamG domain-containing protein n=1 Tax=Actinoallomurus bryophytorum TaxID=1490222 RepID=UPI001639CC8C|nr:LamG domain-containing protein [Actinoallomurus bryophytorum]
MPFESSAPDPRHAASPAEFVAQLRRLKAWSDLTYRRLEKEAMRRGHVLPHSTIATALKRDSLPRTELLAALVSACGCDEETVALWVAVRQRLNTGDGAAAPTFSPATPYDAGTAHPADGSDHLQDTGPARPPDDAGTPPVPVRPRDAGPPGARPGLARRIGRMAPLAAMLLAGMVVLGASSRPEQGHPEQGRPQAGDPATAASTPLPSPAAWWRFEETGGSTAYDSSRHGADAAIGGGATRTAAPGGHALTFDGGGHVTARGPIVRTDEPFTITAWVRLDETDDWGTVVSEHHGAKAPDVALLDYDAEHRDWAFMMPDRRKGWAMGKETVFAGLRPVPARWTHLAVVHDPADRRVCLYVDGALEACRTRASLTRANGPLDIGRAIHDGEPVDGWHGAIDDVRVFPAVLDRAQVGAVAGHRA